MREIVNFRDRQEVQAADFTNLQLYARASFDDLIRDAISGGKGFAGFEVTQATSSDISVAAGRFYTAGAMYYRDTATTVQLASMLPLVTKKKVAIVVWGVPADVDTEPRDFLVDVETGETEPQVVAMHSARQVQMQAIAGIEAPDPQPPANLDVNVLPVAYVTLATSGIIAIEPAVGNRLPSVKDNTALLAALQTWKDTVDPRIATIASEIAEIKRRLTTVGDQHDVLQMAADLARLKELVGLPADGNGSGLDADLVRGTAPTAFGLARLSDTDATAARSGLGLGSASVYAAAAFQPALGYTPVNAAGQNLAAGFTATSYPAGVQGAGGTFTPIPLNGNVQHATNGGAHTLAAPASPCTVVVEYTNNASAGAITPSGFTKVSGAFDAVNGNKFIALIVRTNSYALLQITALQ